MSENTEQGDVDQVRKKGETIRIALVSGFPPMTGNLAEYGYHVAEEYSQRDDVELTVLAPTCSDSELESHPQDYSIERCWTPGSVASVRELVREIRGDDYDVVHFNIQSTWFGSNNVVRFIGLALPVVTRLLTNAKVITTLHDSLDFVDPSALDEDVGVIQRIGSSIATQLVLLSHETTVTTPEFEEKLDEKYPIGSVTHVPHGIFTPIPSYAPPPTSTFTILLFGHIGPHKDYDTVFHSFATLRDVNPNVEIRIAGGEHPYYPEIKAGLEEKYGDWPGVEFTGYVPEDEIEDTFRDASVVVLPYQTSTGVSGVHHLAMTYGRPVIAYKSQEMRVSTVQSGGVVKFVPPNAPDTLARQLATLADDRDELTEICRWNYRAAQRQPLSNVIDRFLELTDGGASPIETVVEQPTKSPTTASVLEGLND